MSIPKTVYQTYKTESTIPENEIPYVKTWRNSKYKYEFYDDEKLYSFIKNEFPQFNDAILNFVRKIEIFDIWRYLILYKYGGIYADTDLELLNDLPEEWFENNQIILSYEPQEHLWGLKNRPICNAFMVSPPKMEFWMDFVKSILSNYNPGSSVLETTGPIALGNFYKESIYFTNSDIYMENNCKIFPSYMSFDGNFIYENRFVTNISKECKNMDIQKESYVIHHWGGKWIGTEAPSQTFFYIFFIIVITLLLIFVLIFF
jgi:mannosyltransferase OCH1-like enzyme